MNNICFYVGLKTSILLQDVLLQTEGLLIKTDLGSTDLFKTKSKFRAGLFESRLTLIDDKKLIKVFISLLKSGFKA